MRPEMKAIREATDQQLATVLTAEQMQQLQQMREEARARMREYVREGSALPWFGNCPSSGWFVPASR